MPPSADRVYWERVLFESHHDLVVIGAGLVGLQTAIRFKQKYPSRSVLVIDRSRPPRGASTRNAGFACFGTVGEFLEDLKHSPMDDVIELAISRWRGMEEMVLHYGKQIDFVREGGFEIFTVGEERAYKMAVDSLDEFNHKFIEKTNKGPVFRLSDNPLKGKDITGVIYNPYEGKLHPGKWILHLQNQAKHLGIGLMAGLEVNQYEESDDSVKIYLQNGQWVKGDQVLLATNAFTRRLLPDADLIPGRNSVFVTRRIPGLRLTGCFHSHMGYIYFRGIQDRLLIGGARHLDLEGEATDVFGVNEEMKKYLQSFTHRVIGMEPEMEFEYEWSGIIALSGQGIKRPIIEKISDRVAVAARLGGMGVALSGEVSKKAAELLSI